MIVMATENQSDPDLSPIAKALLEWAEYWYPISWKGVLVGGAITAIGACATIAFLLLQWRTTAIREEHSEWRTSALELQTANAKTELGKAQAEIAKANVEIEKAKRDAETARLEQERLKAQLAWRTIEPAKLGTIRASLASARGTVFIEYAQNDPEATYFAIQISNLFNDPSRWQVGAGTVAYPNAVVIGFFIRGSEGNETLRQIRSAFTAANIHFSTDPPPNVPVINRSGSAPRGNEDVVISVGSKQPPL